MDLNIMAPINQLGYGIAGLNICKELTKICNTSLSPIGPIEVTLQQDVEPVKKALSNYQMLNFNAPCVKVWHQNDMGAFVGKGKRIGFPFFELDTFDELEKHHLNSLDALFVCSQWAKNICLKNLKLNENQIHVIPLGVDRNLFPTAENNTNKNTIFFNCGKWEVRKGHDVLVEVFNKSFNENDDVELWLMCSNPFLSPEESNHWESFYKQSNLGNKIKILPRAKTQAEVYNVMSQVDCGVFPSRAEGWNLELLELMSCGKNVIATNFSAHTEFCNTENCFLVKTPEIETAYDGKWFAGKGSWAKLSDTVIQDFIKNMKNIHQLKQSQELKPNKNGVITAEKFSWEESARKILYHVQHIQEN